MSDWEFLWGLKGQELEDAMGCGCNYDDLRWIASEEHRERVRELERIVRNADLRTTPVQDSERVDPEMLVFIDAENISAAYYAEIRRILTNLGSQISVIAYARQKDDTTHGWHVNAAKYEELFEKRLFGPPEKDKCDRKIIKDVWSFIEDYDNETIIVIVTSDAGFAQSIAEWREEGYIIIGLGESKAPQRLRKAYTKFIELRPL